ncbi:zinc ribbon domain-containing protein, partial [Geitlerinema sp. CS-897]|nr:zinc ribbon domain-containing protein [Geitlerinema sp. CS-897]
PTSEICSCCGYRWGKLDLSIRSVLCINCGAEHDRDVNAGKNIEAAGLCRPEWANAKQCETSLEAVACLSTRQESASVLADWESPCL